jgi:hypothetical protein
MRTKKQVEARLASLNQEKAVEQRKLLELQYAKKETGEPIDPKTLDNIEGRIQYYRGLVTALEWVLSDEE